MSAHQRIAIGQCHLCGERPGAETKIAKKKTAFLCEVCAVLPHMRANPLIARAGEGPAGVTCSTCKHLIKHSDSRNYYKCAYRGDTSSAATDHRVNWPACAKYEENEQP